MKRSGVDYYTGCLVGGAIGDALGAPVEFMSMDKIRKLYGEQGVTDFVEFPDHTGAFTDDTQMTLFTAEGLLRAFHRASLKGIGGALEKITYQSYLRWLHTQDHEYSEDPDPESLRILGEGWLIQQEALYRVRAPGNTCLYSLRSGKCGTMQLPLNDSKGCGTIMRVTPVGLMFYGENRRSFETACELSAMTHGHPTGFLSAGFFASVISDLVVGVDLLDCIRNAGEILKTYEKHEETLEAVEHALDLYHECDRGKGVPGPELVEMLGSGWVAEEALAISLFSSLVYPHDFRSGVLLSVNHGGDCDSTGSITGNILGLINGIEKIPEDWRGRLQELDLVRQVGEDLQVQVKGNTFNSDQEWWAKYPGY